MPFFRLININLTVKSDNKDGTRGAVFGSLTSSVFDDYQVAVCRRALVFVVGDR
jgi:hypothetical protein